jgi:YjbE family integral membrane protein
MEPGSIWLTVSALEIILIDLVLSGDNAIIIAMATRNLDRKNRKKAFILGAMGAILLRVFFASIASLSIMKFSLLEFFGGLVLLWIAVRLLTDDGRGPAIKPQQRLVSAVKTIILADLIMSLDNVLAVGGAAHGNLVLLVSGLLFSMTILMLGSQVLASLMSRFEFVTSVGAGVIAWVAGDMICSVENVKNFFSSHASFFIPTISIIFVFFTAELIQSRINRRI